MKRPFIIIPMLLMLICLTAASVKAAEAFRFTDVPADAWYYNDVKSAVESGIINGKTDKIFSPDDHLTCAEAVKLAACVHQRHAEGKVTLTNGTPWYQSYVDYARANGIIALNYPWMEPATRGKFVEIMTNALPEAEYVQINEIPDGSVPDVLYYHPQEKQIYTLYRAGILQGSGKKRCFNTFDPIKRSEVAAILARMTDSSKRVRFSMEYFDDVTEDGRIDGSRDRMVRVLSRWGFNKEADELILRLYDSIDKCYDNIYQYKKLPKDAYLDLYIDTILKLKNVNLYKDGSPGAEAHNLSYWTPAEFEDSVIE